MHSCQTDKQPGVVIKVDFEKIYDKTHWDYLLEVLTSRKFGTKWIQRITQWLYSSQSCVLINDTLSEYFYCKIGVRQGDPLSPFWYILAANTLSKIFFKGRHQDKIVGLVLPAYTISPWQIVIMLMIEFSSWQPHKIM